MRRYGLRLDGTNLNRRRTDTGLPSLKLDGNGWTAMLVKKSRSARVSTWLCPPLDEQCEVYYYDGVLSIDYKGRHRKFDITGFG